MMKKNVLMKIGERTELKEKLVPAQYDESGSIISDERIEQEEVIVPIMQAMDVDMTADEEAEHRVDNEYAPVYEPTLEEQVQDLTDLVAILTEVIANG